MMKIAADAAIAHTIIVTSTVLGKYSNVAT